MKKCAARRRCGLRAEQRRSPLTLFSDHYQKDRKSTRLNSSHSQISYAVFCLKKKKNLLGGVSDSPIGVVPSYPLAPLTSSGRSHMFLHGACLRIVDAGYPLTSLLALALFLSV